MMPKLTDIMLESVHLRSMRCVFNDCRQTVRNQWRQAVLYFWASSWAHLAWIFFFSYLWGSMSADSWDSLLHKCSLKLCRDFFSLWSGTRAAGADRILPGRTRGQQLLQGRWSFGGEDAASWQWYIFHQNIVRINCIKINFGHVMLQTPISIHCAYIWGWFHNFM